MTNQEKIAFEKEAQRERARILRAIRHNVPLWERLKLRKYYKSNTSNKADFERGYYYELIDSTHTALFDIYRALFPND